MTRYVIGPDVALRLAGLEAEVPTKHRLLAPTLITSQVLAQLYEAVHRGELAYVHWRAPPTTVVQDGVCVHHRQMERGCCPHG